MCVPTRNANDQMAVMRSVGAQLAPVALNKVTSPIEIKNEWNGMENKGLRQSINCSCCFAPYVDNK